MKAQGLYDPQNERDGCGMGFIAHVKGERSNAIIAKGLEILAAFDHRGGVGADPEMGDGAGCLIQIPDPLFRAWAEGERLNLPPPGDYAVAMCFLPVDEASRAAAVERLEHFVRIEGQVLVGWRDVPVDESVLGRAVREIMPVIRQAVVARGPNVKDQAAFDRKLLAIRKQTQNPLARIAEKQGLPELADFYLPSLSSRTLVYKGMLLPHLVGEFYKDLKDPLCVSALAMVHQRFSTNTFPSWRLAHPYRFIAHNGEINTLRGNVNWMNARRRTLESRPDRRRPRQDVADHPARPVRHRLPRQCARAAPRRRLFARPCGDAAHPRGLVRHADGAEAARLLRISCRPDGAVGRTGGDRLHRRPPDRRHPRPQRPAPGALLRHRRRSRRHGLGDRRAADPRGEDRPQVAAAARQDAADRPRRGPHRRGRGGQGDASPTPRLMPNGCARPSSISRTCRPANPVRDSDPADLPSLQRIFGYTDEDLKFFLAPMAAQGDDPVGSMGTDTPLALLSDRPRLLYDYFKQNFAQVTNPPIDPIRESLVMSLVSMIGPRPNLLGHQAGTHKRLEVSQPILTNEDVEKIRAIRDTLDGAFRTTTLDATFPKGGDGQALEAALQRLCWEATEAVLADANVLIVSDRAAGPSRIPIPAALATGAVHHHLIRQGLRMQTGLVIETGEAREVHHFCVLAGYGAEAVNPWLAFDTIAALTDEPNARANYIKAIGKGLLKVMSKMGISTYQSYCGAQIFDAVGIGRCVVDKYFTGTATRIEGIGLAELAEECARRHRTALAANDEFGLDVGGIYAQRIGGEAHAWTFQSIADLQHAVRGNLPDKYRAFADALNAQSRAALTLRGLLDFKPAGPAVPLDEVEPASAIVRRFTTGAMSFGSISREAHTTLAVAMNRIGGRSNTGEGGEESDRFRPLANGDSERSAIKQVASGRFGVTTEYLVNADELQIKIAQGAKPGEGGQLPGHKVDRHIAAVRHSTPGVGLISPPPHHDIYSIEDLAQLIHDLRSVNPASRISVKLVAEVGVGTVAAGVAKCTADHVTIAGYEGGTGASPLTSLTHAGLPWEIGLAETQQTLVLNGLRGRICVQADGGLRTGRDVAVAAMLGADEYGFATAPLIAAGCIMMRKCHLNTCPVGIATQDPVLRAKFTGTPEHVINYFFFVAEELRAIMAGLGIRTVDDLIGRTDLIEPRDAHAHWKARGIDLTRLLHRPAGDGLLRHVAPLCRQVGTPVDRQMIETLDGPMPVRIERRVAQCRPLARRDGLGRDRPPPRPSGPARRQPPRRARRIGRPELRRLHRPRRHPRAGRRRQRLCRQGPRRRPPDRPPARSGAARRGRQHHRRQHLPLRRDRGRGLFQRRRRRALRGPQFGRRRNRRGHRRPWLRIHDRRHNRRPRQRRPQLRRRHVGRHRAASGIPRRGCRASAILPASSSSRSRIPKACAPWSSSTGP